MTGVPFAVTPEWVLDADISDRAVRLYGILTRYGSTDGGCFPSRQTLASRLRCSVDTVDRAIKELADIGAVTPEERFRKNGSQTSNRYWVRYEPPGYPPGEPQERGGVKGAADPRPPDRELTDTGRSKDLHGDGRPVKNQPVATPLIDVKDDPFWTERPAVLTRLKAAGLPDEMLDPSYAHTVELLTEGSEVFWDDEMVRYQAWWADQPPSGRHKKRTAGFRRWLDRALAADRARVRRDAERKDGWRRAQPVR